MVVLRNYTDSDYDSLVRLWAEAGIYNPSSDKRGVLKRKIEDFPKSILLAEDRGKVVGSVVMIFDPWMATIFRLAIKKSYQRKDLGKGLAVQLMSEAEKRVRAIGAEAVGVYVSEGRGKSREKGGYSLFGTYDCLEKKL